MNAHKKNPRAFDYMMLDRMRLNCEYYLGHGNRSVNTLGGYSVAEHIAEMKRRWNDFPVEGKPEWLTWEQILEYELKMGD